MVRGVSCSHSLGNPGEGGAISIALSFTEPLHIIPSLQVVKVTRAKSEQPALLQQLEAHYGLTGLSTFEAEVKTNSASAAWKAAADAGGRPKVGGGGKATSATAGTSSVTVEWDGEAAAARAAGISKPDAKGKDGGGKTYASALETKEAGSDRDAVPVKASYSRAAAAAIVAADLAWKLQSVAAAACTALVELHAEAAATGADARAVIVRCEEAARSRGRASEPAGSGSDDDEAAMTAADDAVVAAGSNGGSVEDLLEQLQLIRDAILLQRRASSLSSASTKAFGAVYRELHPSEPSTTTVGPDTSSSRSGAGRQQRSKPRQQYAPNPPMATKRAADAGGRARTALMRCGDALWALLLTAATWRASPPVELYEEAVSKVNRLLLEPAGITKVRRSPFAQPS